LGRREWEEREQAQVPANGDDLHNMFVMSKPQIKAKDQGSWKRSRNLVFISWVAFSRDVRRAKFNYQNQFHRANTKLEGEWKENFIFSESLDRLAHRGFYNGTVGIWQTTPAATKNHHFTRNLAGRFRDRTDFVN